MFVIIKKKLLKNTFKVILQYLFNLYLLFNTVSYIKFNFKLKIDTKMCTLKNLKEIWKNELQPCLPTTNNSVVLFCSYIQRFMVTSYAWWVLNRVKNRLPIVTYVVVDWFTVLFFLKEHIAVNYDLDFVQN